MGSSSGNAFSLGHVGSFRNFVSRQQSISPRRSKTKFSNSFARWRTEFILLRTAENHRIPAFQFHSVVMLYRLRKSWIRAARKVCFPRQNIDSAAGGKQLSQDAAISSPAHEVTLTCLSHPCRESKHLSRDTRVSPAGDLMILVILYDSPRDVTTSSPAPEVTLTCLSLSCRENKHPSRDAPPFPAGGSDDFVILVLSSLRHQPLSRDAAPSPPGDHLPSGDRAASTIGNLLFLQNNIIDLPLRQLIYNN